MGIVAPNIGPAAAPVLQGKATKSVFANHETFQSVIDLNPDYDSWQSQEKEELAGQFFNEKYSGYTPQEQGEIRLEFNKKYGVGSVAPGFEKRQFFNPTPGAPDQISDYLNAAALYAGGVFDPANDLLNPFWRSAKEGQEAKARQVYPGIENDPGFLGDAYRFHGNRWANTAGQLVGAAGAVRNIAAALPQQALSKFPLLGALPEAAQSAIAATGIFSGATNAADVAHGKQTPLQAVGNTVLDTATAPLGGSSRLKNTAIQGLSGGASGYLSSLIADATSGRPLDFDAALRASGEQAAFGAGMGLGLPGGGKRSEAPRRVVQGRALKEQIPVERIVAGVTERAKARSQERISNEATNLIQLRNKGMDKEARAILGALRPETRARIESEIRQFDNKNAARQAIGNKRIQQAVAELGPQNQTKKGKPLPSNESEAIKARLLEKYKVTPEQRQQKAYENRADLDNQKTQNRLKVEEAKSAGKTAPINAKANLEAQKQATIKARNERSQALLDISKAREEMRAAKAAKDEGSYRSAQSKHDKAQERKAKAEKVITESKKPTGQPKPAAQSKADASTHEARRGKLEQAINEGRAVTVEHRAEKAGTRDDSTFRKKLDLPYEFGENEKGEFVRVVNENGQVSMRYLEDLHGEVRISDERHPYTFDREGVYKAGAKKGETGRFRVLDEDGNEVVQGRSNLTKDSDLASKLGKMDEIVTRVKKGDNPTAREILDAGKGMDKASFKKALEKLTPEQVDEIAKDLGC